MSSKPETRLIGTIHKYLKRLPDPPYWEKNWNAYRAGTPDVFYSGDKDCMWVEYKFVPHLPRRSMYQAALSPLQRTWLYRRGVEGRTVAVIVGVGESHLCAILTAGTWMYHHDPNLMLLETYTSVAAWIKETVGGGCYE